MNSNIKVPFYSLEKIHTQCADSLQKAFNETLQSNWFVLGNRLQLLEQNFANYLSCKYVAGVSNGLEALQISLLALGIGAGDEVIVPAHTFIASFIAVTQIGAKPIPVDVNPSTCNLCVKNCQAVINSRTKAIMPVHLYGNPCPMNEIMVFAYKHNLWVVEDNAQAVGASFTEEKTGTFGHINACSFYPSKTLGALGDAGAISTNDTVLYEKVLRLRNYGASGKYEFSDLGLNARMDELQAAFLSVKLPYIDQWNAERRQLALQYENFFSTVGYLTLPQKTPQSFPVYHLFPIRTNLRDELKIFLLQKGVQTVIHYPQPPHLQVAFKYLKYQKGDFPITEKICNTTLSLPLFPGMSEAQQNYIIDCVKIFFQEKGK